jgi:hypothetical protein
VCPTLAAYLFTAASALRKVSTPRVSLRDHSDGHAGPPNAWQFKSWLAHVDGGHRAQNIDLHPLHPLIEKPRELPRLMPIPVRDGVSASVKWKVLADRYDRMNESRKRF